MKALTLYSWERKPTGYWVCFALPNLRSLVVFDGLSQVQKNQRHSHLRENEEEKHSKTSGVLQIFRADSVIVGSVLVSKLAQYCSVGQVSIDCVARRITEIRSAMER